MNADTVPLHRYPTFTSQGSAGKTAVFGIAKNAAALLCYLPVLNGLLPILWLATEPGESRFLRFHALQALLAPLVYVAVAFGIDTLVFLLEIVLFFASLVVGMLVPKLILVTFGLQIALFVAAPTLTIFLIACLIVGYVSALIGAYRGDWWEIPLVGSFCKRLV